MVVDDEAKPAAPAFAWFDPRGAAQVAAFPAEVRAEFAGRTGLPLGPQASVAKLAYLRDQGLELDGLRWLNLPEFVVTTLGGRAGAELSLASRTGLLDQDTGAPWPAMLDALGDHGGLPAAPRHRGHRPRPDRRRAARSRAPGSPSRATTTSSRPRPTARSPTARYHVSMGTAEVLLRVIDAPLGYAARARLAEHLINEVRHVVPGKHVLVAGLKSGLLLRRTLQALGIRDRDGRDRLDAAVMAIPLRGHPPRGRDRGRGRAQRRRRARAHRPHRRRQPRRRSSPPSSATATTRSRGSSRHGRREFPPATSATLTGGWAAMASVRRARAAILPDVSRLRPGGRKPRSARPAWPRACCPLNPPSPGGTMNPLTTRERRGMTAISTRPAAC